MSMDAHILDGIPVGRQVNEGIFLAELEVDVHANGAVEAPAAVLDAVAPLGYVPGQFDASAIWWRMSLCRTNSAAQPGRPARISATAVTAECRLPW